MNNYLQWFESDDDEWTIENAFNYIDWLARFASVFQSFQANAVTRMAMQIWRRVSHMMFDDKKVTDYGTYQIDVNMLEQTNQLIKSVVWEFWTWYRSINELVKMKNMWVQSYFENRFFKQYYFKNMYAQYNDVDMVYDTPWSLMYFLLWAANDVQKTKFDQINTQFVQKSIIDWIQWDWAWNSSWYWWMLASFWMRSFINSVNIMKPILTFNQTELSDNEKLWAEWLYHNDVSELVDWNDIEWLYWKIYSTWSPEAENIKNWLRKYLASRVMNPEFVYTNIENVDEEWNYLPADEATDSFKKQIMDWFSEKMSAADYTKYLSTKFKEWTPNIDNIFWKEYADKIRWKYWDLLDDPKSFRDFLNNPWKEWQLADIMSMAWIDYQSEWWAALFLQKMASHEFNLLKSWNKYVVDPRNFELKDTKETISLAYNKAVSEWNQQMKARIEDAFFTKKGKWKKNFSKKIAIRDDWTYVVQEAGDEDRIKVIQDKIIKEYLPYLKTTNFEEYWNVIMKADHSVNYLANPEKSKSIGSAVYNTLESKDWWIDYTAMPKMNPQLQKYYWDNMLAMESLKKWDVDMFMAKFDMMWVTKIFWPRDKDWAVIPFKDLSDKMKNAVTISNMYMLNDALKNIESLPISDIHKVWAYAALIKKWWFETMAKLDTIKWDLPELALAALESLTRNLLWWTNEIPTVAQHAIIDEAARLSWVSRWDDQTEWWKKWKSVTLKKSDLNLLKDFVESANKSVRFKDLPNLPDAPKTPAITFSSWEQRFIKNIRWWNPAKSESYDKSWWSSSSGGTSGKSLTYWRRTTTRSKKKGLKTLAIR